MSYLEPNIGYYARRGHGVPRIDTDLGCGPSCTCGPCQSKFHGYAETYERDEDDDEPGTQPGMGETPCPAPAGTTTDRCTSGLPHPCPPIPNLLCVRSARGIPFEYAIAAVTDPATGLKRPKAPPPRPSHTVRVVPSVVAALEAFVDNMRRFGLPIEAILTAGSLYCRCITNTDHLSNHSFGDAFDLVGVRWVSGGPRPSRLPETIVHNFADLAGERILLRRINACLRLSFARVIDYHRADHRDHFHCDMNRGHGRALRESTTLKFVQEALEHVLRRSFPRTGKLDTATQAGLREYGGLPPSTPFTGVSLERVLDSLFRFMASAGRMR